MFLVVGETARSQNYALNGYSRGTNDFTKKYNEAICKELGVTIPEGYEAVTTE